MTIANTPVTKAVIPVAGLGTRMLPATKAIPKEMLPLVDKPLIQYIIEECVSAGIKDIVLVTHASKQAIENHFDCNFELEQILEQKGKDTLLEQVRALCPADVTISTVRQGTALGLGHAILCAEPVIGEEPFAILLPDVLLSCAHNQENNNNLANMLTSYHQSQQSVIMVEPVAPEEVNKYGIADCNGTAILAGQHTPLQAVVEKPAIDEAPSNMAIVGRYVLSPSIWHELKHTTAGVGGEIQLTDAIESLMKTEVVNAFHMTGISYDCGDKLGYMKACVEFGLRHPELQGAFGDYLTLRPFQDAGSIAA